METFFDLFFLLPGGPQDLIIYNIHTDHIFIYIYIHINISLIFLRDKLMG